MVRYVGRHGEGRVAKVVLISAVTPVMRRSETNPDGLPQAAFDGLRERDLRDPVLVLGQAALAALAAYRAAAS